MVPVDEALGELSNLSAQLNEQTEVLNSLILIVEKRLANAKIGVSVWLDPSEALLGEIYNGTKRDGWQLGYGKIGDSWRILAKSIKQYYQRDSEDPTEGFWVTDEYGEPVALANAPRQIRVEAAEHLERLITELSEKVRKFLANIEQAKTLVAPDF